MVPPHTGKVAPLWAVACPMVASGEESVRIVVGAYVLPMSYPDLCFVPAQTGVRAIVLEGQA